MKRNHSHYRTIRTHSADLHKVKVLELVVLRPGLAAVGRQERDTLHLRDSRVVVVVVLGNAIKARRDESASSPAVRAVGKVDGDQRATRERELLRHGLPAVGSAVDDSNRYFVARTHKHKHKSIPVVLDRSVKQTTPYVRATWDRFPQRQPSRC